MNDPDLKGQLRNQGMEPVFIEAGPMRSQMEAEINQYRAIAHRARIVVD